MSKQKTLYSAMIHAQDALKKYKARVKAADDALQAKKDDPRVSSYGKQEALQERNEAIRIAEKTLRESIRVEKEALTISEQERTRVEILNNESLRLLETLRSIDVTKQDLELYAREYQADGNLTMVRALAQIAKQNGFQFNNFHAADDNIASFAKLEALTDQWLRNRANETAFSADPVVNNLVDTVMSTNIDDMVASLLAEADPTAEHPEITVTDIPATVEEEFAQSIQEEKAAAQEATADPQAEELIAQAFGVEVENHAAEQIQALARAKADAVQLENELEADEADKADGATAGDSADQSAEKPNKYEF